MLCQTNAIIYINFIGGPSPLKCYPVQLFDANWIKSEEQIFLETARASKPNESRQINSLDRELISMKWTSS